MSPLSRFQWQQRAMSSVKTTVELLCRDARAADDEERRWVSRDTAEFLWFVLWEVQDLAEHVDYADDDDWHTADARNIARRLHRALRDRTRTAKLERVEGRTPAEADTHRRKADELRRRAP